MRITAIVLISLFSVCLVIVIVVIIKLYFIRTEYQILSIDKGKTKILPSFILNQVLRTTSKVSDTWWFYYYQNLLSIIIILILNLNKYIHPCGSKQEKKISPSTFYHYLDYREALEWLKEKSLRWKPNHQRLGNASYYR